MIRRVVAAISAAVVLFLADAVTPVFAAEPTTATDLQVGSFHVWDVVLDQGGQAFVQDVHVTFNQPLPAGADPGVYLWAPNDSNEPFDALPLTKGSDGDYHASEPFYQEDPTGTWIAEVVVYGSADEDAEPLVDVWQAFDVKEGSLLQLNAAPEPVAVGGKVSVNVALWCVSPKKDGALRPCSGRRVKVYFNPDGSSPKQLVGTYTTDKSGEIDPLFTAAASGTWSASFASAADVWGSDSNGDHVTVVKKATRLTVDAGPEPAAVGEVLTVTGTLTHATSASPKATYSAYPSKRIDVYFDPAGKAPRTKVATVTTDAKGQFAKKFTAKTTGVWSAQFAGTSSYAAVRSNGDNVVVAKKKTHLTLNAGPEPAKKGSQLTVSGRLTHATSVRGTRHDTPYKSETLTVWFDPAGPKGATKMATVTTNAKGEFSKKLAQSVDGTWRATFAGTHTYAAASSNKDHVDVK